jgi:hypothetical protein
MSINSDHFTPLVPRSASAPTYGSGDYESDDEQPVQKRSQSVFERAKDFFRSKPKVKVLEPPKATCDDQLNTLTAELMTLNVDVKRSSEGLNFTVYDREIKSAPPRQLTLNKEGGSLHLYVRYNGFSEVTDSRSFDVLRGRMLEIAAGSPTERFSAKNN